MVKPLRILLLEDSLADAALISRALAESGVAFDLRHAQSKEEFVGGLEGKAVDLILSDYRVPGFDGLAALDFSRSRYPEIPFIFVTGALGEEATIATFERGASDYVLKNRLAKLGPAVIRAWQEAEERKRRIEAEAERDRLIHELQGALAKVKTLRGLLPICAGCKQIRDDDGYWKQLEIYLREHSDATFTHGLCPQCAERLYPGFTAAAP